jgi:hypothetical protein
LHSLSAFSLPLPASSQTHFLAISLFPGIVLCNIFFRHVKPSSSLPAAGED